MWHWPYKVDSTPVYVISCIQCHLFSMVNVTTDFRFHFNMEVVYIYLQIHNIFMYIHI